MQHHQQQQVIEALATDSDNKDTFHRINKTHTLESLESSFDDRSETMGGVFDQQRN